MNFSDASEASVDSGYSRPPMKAFALAALATALVALTVYGAPAAADSQDAEAETAAIADTESGETRRRSDAGAEDGETDAAGKAEPADAPDAERDVVLVEMEPVQECRSVRVTGSRVPKQVCTTVQPTLGEQAEEAAAERRTEDYLRRRDQLSTLPDPDDDDGLINSGLFD